MNRPITGGDMPDANDRRGETEDEAEEQLHLMLSPHICYAEPSKHQGTAATHAPELPIEDYG